MSHAAKHTILSAIFLASLSAAGCQQAVAPGSYLVEGEVGINGIAVDEFDVYFIRKDGRLKKVSLDGGKAVELVSGIKEPTAIALDRDTVYWVTATGAIGSLPKKGGDPGTLVDDEPGQVALAALGAGDDVYFATASAGLQSVPKSGGEPTSLLGGGVMSTGGMFGYDGGGFLYAMNGQGELIRVTTDGKGTFVMTDQQAGTTSVAANSSFVYWVNPNPPGADSGSSQPQGKVFRMRPDGNDIVTVAVEQEDPFRVAGDEKNVYWTTTTGTVFTAPVDGAAEPFPMASADPGEVYLALDATTIYWARSDGGTISARPKPEDPAE